MFINQMEETLNNEFNYNQTENGALGYRTTGKELLDINFQVASLRSASQNEIVDKFMKSFYEDKLLAVKWLFYARDIREGLGERNLFRVIVKYLSVNNTDVISHLVKFIPFYGRFDDMWGLLGTKTEKEVISIVKEQLENDLKNCKENKPISLLAKWMPSINTSSKETVKNAKKLCVLLEMSEKQYRKTLSSLRKYIDVVEVKMSAKNWSEIDYSGVPSRANLIYNGAFLKNDEERRRKFLEKVDSGEEKINASVLFPHDIVHKYNQGSWGNSLKRYDATLEALWKALPNLVKENDNTIVVADGSGSMKSTIGKSNVSALSVANSLAIYFAEHSGGQFKDKYITFSSRPQLVDFSKCSSLREKLEVALRYSEIADTNIEAVFDLILTTAVKNNTKQEDIPKNILIISDMEFNSCGGEYLGERLFETISKKYNVNGYKLPRLIFWNVNSRTKTIPMIENPLGVILVSGFSPNIVKMLMENKTDPYNALVKQLNSERYSQITI